jgi:uncharacterized protein (TIGR02246 family)
MNSEKPSVSSSTANGESEVQTLHQQILEAWNRRDAHGMASLFAPDGNVIGFDGSQINGRAEIESEMGRIFADHTPATYVGKVREVRFLTPDVAVLRAVVGMVPPRQADLNSNANAVQTMIAVRQDGDWRITVYHPRPLHFMADRSSYSNSPTNCENCSNP